MSERPRDFDHIPAIKPAQDEVASYRRSGRSEATGQSNFNGVLVFVIVLMAIMMGIGGYALWEVQNKLDESNQLLDKGQQNIRDLESRLSQTGDTASQRFQSMEAQINTNVSEIDKLWAVAYRQNKPDIAANLESIQALQKENAQLGGQLAELKTSIQTVTDDFTQLSTQLATDTEDMTTQLSLVRGQVQDQSTVVEANRRQMAVLNKNIKDLQEAIDVIDRYRQQINQRLIELQTQVQGAEPPS